MGHKACGAVPKKWPDREENSLCVFAIQRMRCRWEWERGVSLHSCDQRPFLGVRGARCTLGWATQTSLSLWWRLDTKGRLLPFKCPCGHHSWKRQRADPGTRDHGCRRGARSGLLWSTLFLQCSLRRGSHTHLLRVLYHSSLTCVELFPELFLEWLKPLIEKLVRASSDLVFVTCECFWPGILRFSFKNTSFPLCK